MPKNLDQIIKLSKPPRLSLISIINARKLLPPLPSVAPAINYKQAISFWSSIKSVPSSRYAINMQINAHCTICSEKDFFCIFLSNYFQLPVISSRYTVCSSVSTQQNLPILFINFWGAVRWCIWISLYMASSCS